MPLRLSLIVALSSGLTGCGSPSTGPGGQQCDTQAGVEVCAERSQYSPTDIVRFTVRNRGFAPIYMDACSTKPVGVTSLSNEFEAVFNPTLRCGAGATTADVVANMVEIPPGEMSQATVQIVSFAFQGFYRVNVWIVDAEGMLVPPAPAVSGIFEVFPSAG